MDRQGQTTVSLVAARDGPTEANLTSLKEGFSSPIGHSTWWSSAEEVKDEPTREDGGGRDGGASN